MDKLKKLLLHFIVEFVAKFIDELKLKTYRVCGWISGEFSWWKGAILEFFSAANWILSDFATKSSLKRTEIIARACPDIVGSVIFKEFYNKLRISPISEEFQRAKIVNSDFW